MKTTRRGFLSYPKFQLTLVFVNCMLIFLVILYFIFRTMHNFRFMANMGVEANLESDHPYYRYLEIQENLLINDFLIGGFLCLFLSSIFILFYSHRITGPMVRLRKYLQDACEGKPVGKLTFRKNDDFFDISDLINKFMEISRKKTE